MSGWVSRHGLPALCVVCVRGDSLALRVGVRAGALKRGLAAPGSRRSFPAPYPHASKRTTKLRFIRMAVATRADQPTGFLRLRRRRRRLEHLLNDVAVVVGTGTISPGCPLKLAAWPPPTLAFSGTVPLLNEADALPPQGASTLFPSPTSARTQSGAVFARSFSETRRLTRVGPNIADPHWHVGAHARDPVGLRVRADARSTRSRLRPLVPGRTTANECSCGAGWIRPGRAGSLDASSSLCHPIGHPLAYPVRAGIRVIGEHLDPGSRARAPRRARARRTAHTKGSLDDVPRSSQPLARSRSRCPRTHGTQRPRMSESWSAPGNLAGRPAALHRGRLLRRRGDPRHRTASGPVSRGVHQQHRLPLGPERRGCREPLRRRGRTCHGTRGRSASSRVGDRRVPAAHDHGRREVEPLNAAPISSYALECVVTLTRRGPGRAPAQLSTGTSRPVACRLTPLPDTPRSTMSPKHLAAPSSRRRCACLRGQGRSRSPSLCAT